MEDGGGGGRVGWGLCEKAGKVNAHTFGYRKC